MSQFFVLPDSSAILGLIVIAKHGKEFTLANSNLSKIRHQVVGNAERVFTKDTRGMSTSGVKVTQKSCIPSLLGGANIANDVFNELLGSTIRIGCALIIVSCSASIISLPMQKIDPSTSSKPRFLSLHMLSHKIYTYSRQGFGNRNDSRITIHSSRRRKHNVLDT